MKASITYRDQVLREALFTEALRTATTLQDHFQIMSACTEEADLLARTNEVQPHILKLQEIDRMLRGYATENRG